MYGLLLRLFHSNQHQGTARALAVADRAERRPRREAGLGGGYGPAGRVNGRCLVARALLAGAGTALAPAVSRVPHLEAHERVGGGRRALPAPASPSEHGLHGPPLALSLWYPAAQVLQALASLAVAQEAWQTPRAPLSAVSPLAHCVHFPLSGGADAPSGLSVYLIAPAVPEEIVSLALGAGAAAYCLAERCSAVRCAVAVQGGLLSVCAPRAVGGPPDPGPALCAPVGRHRALLPAGAPVGGITACIPQSPTRGAGGALVGTGTDTRGARGVAPLAGLVSVAVVPAEGRAVCYALAGRGEVVVRDARCAGLVGCLQVGACLAVGVLQVC